MKEIEVTRIHDSPYHVHTKGWAEFDDAWLGPHDKWLCNVETGEMHGVLEMEYIDVPDNGIGVPPWKYRTKKVAVAKVVPPPQVHDKFTVVYDHERDAG